MQALPFVRRRVHGAALAMALVASCSCAQAQDGAIQGWIVRQSPYRFADLIGRLETAVKAHRMTVVNFASASEGAKAQGITIPGNRVVGVFRNDFARRLLATDLRAGIEAPIRFYLTEGEGGMATLSYRTPSSVLAPYVSQSSFELRDISKELDTIFDAIATDATKE